MKTEEIHKIIRLAREKHYDLDHRHFQFMCHCVHQLDYDSKITGDQSYEVVVYIDSLLDNFGSLKAYLSIVKGVDSKSMKAAQLEFWNDLLEDDE